MRKQKVRASIWKSFLSVLTLGVFVLIAVGSVDLGPDTTTEFLGDGVYQESAHYSNEGQTTITTGKHDPYGRWTGPVTINIQSEFEDYSYIEEVNMLNGLRHGKSTITFTNGHVTNRCYKMGMIVDCQESGLKSLAVLSSFQVLCDKYPWFVYTLNSFGYEDEYIEAYMDTLETVLGTYEFEASEFDDFYEDVLSDLEETPYDSIIASNATISTYLGTEELKNSELRLAVIDHFRWNGLRTYDIVNVTYPNYLLSISDSGIGSQDFEDFCEVLDSCMISYGPLDLDDPDFIDNVDNRLSSALFAILNYEEPDTTALKSVKSGKLRGFSYLGSNASIDSTTIEVAGVVLVFMMQQIDRGDIMKRAVREAYMENAGIIRVPAVTTEFSGHNSATSVTLEGYVLEDGGADVTSRGITLATFYNPTTDDQAEPSGSGTGGFAVVLDGLTEGATYYARTYATNSAGTAFGNCISFTASGAVGLEEVEMVENELNIYPNPTSGITTIRFQLALSKSMVLKIIDLKGQVVFQRDLGSLPQDENLIQLDLSSLTGGIYNLQLSNDGTIHGTRKLILIK
ncbi:MAG: T9SS type A sorting domain-containing protein [Bacteroidota bacterium]